MVEVREEIEYPSAIVINMSDSLAKWGIKSKYDYLEKKENYILSALETICDSLSYSYHASCTVRLWKVSLRIIS